MKKVNIFIFSAILFIAGCTKKTDAIFDKSVDERLTEAVTNLQNAIVAAPGWKLFVYPMGLDRQHITVKGLTYYVKFSNTNRVTMVSDLNNGVISATPKESGYRLKAMQRPSLIFDTYTYMHIPADPDPDVSLPPVDASGFSGLGTDYNFSFTETAIKDTFILKGNFNNSAAVLIKATQAEMDAAFTKSRLKDIINFTAAYPAANPFLYFQSTASLKTAVGIDINTNMLSFSSIAGTNLISNSIGFSYTTYGLHFKSPVTVGNYTFQDVYWDDAKKLYYILSGTTHIEFITTATPQVSIALNSYLGNPYTLFVIPPGASLPNQSPLFITKYNAAVNGMLTGPYRLSTGSMIFEFDVVAKTMTMITEVAQNATQLVVVYYYNYTIDAGGYYKFTKYSQNVNGPLVLANMNNIISYFDTDTFKLDGLSTSSAFLGQFTSRQTPAFYFTGSLY